MHLHNFLKKSFCCMGNAGTGKSSVIVDKAWENDSFDRKILIDPKGDIFFSQRYMDDRTIHAPLDQGGLILLGSLLVYDVPFSIALSSVRCHPAMDTYKSIGMMLSKVLDNRNRSLKTRIIFDETDHIMVPELANIILENPDDLSVGCTFIDADSMHNHGLDKAKFDNHIFLKLHATNSIDYARKKIGGFPLSVDLMDMAFGDYCAVSSDLCYQGNFRTENCGPLIGTKALAFKNGR